MFASYEPANAMAQHASTPFRSTWENLQDEDNFGAAMSELHLVFNPNPNSNNSNDSLFSQFEYSSVPTRNLTVNDLVGDIPSSLMFDQQWEALVSAIYGNADDNDYELNLLLADIVGKVECGVDDVSKVTTMVQVNEASAACTSCPICFEDFDALAIENGGASKTNCNHYFCNACITRWLSGSKKCPVCMHELDAA